MSYTINKTDGSILTEIIDGNIDQTSSDITLISKNASTYGEFINENFVHILENFANSSSPENPIMGQLWYDTSASQLKVYDGAGFKAAAGTYISNTIPTTLSQGDLWIDSFHKQLFFNDGVNTILVGPSYSEQQGISGLIVSDIFDMNNSTKTIVSLYVSNILFGIFSKDTFIPKTPIPGYSDNDHNRQITVGFNVGTIADIKFDITVTKSLSLTKTEIINGVDTEILYYPDDFVLKSDDSTLSGSLLLTNSTPLILGPNAANTVNVSSSLIQFNTTIPEQNFEIITGDADNVFSSAIYIDTATQTVKIFKDLTDNVVRLEVAGGATVKKDLTVEGTVITQSLQIKDNTLTLNSVTSPSDSNANGGGIELKGDGVLAKSILWDNSLDSWISSENFNLDTGKSYYIENLKVLGKNQYGQIELTSNVLRAPGLTSIGTLGNLTVSDTIHLGINGSEYNASISSNSVGIINVNNAKISNLSTPSSDGDAVNYGMIRYNNLGLYVDSTTAGNGAKVLSILTEMYPPGHFRLYTHCIVVYYDDGPPGVSHSSVYEIQEVDNLYTWVAL